MEKEQFNQTLTQDVFTALVNNRHSVRSYDTTFKLSKDELTDLLKQASQAPSCGNLQAFRFLVLDTLQLQQQLLPIAYNQKQIVESSAVIAILGDLKCYEMAEKIYTDIQKAGYLSEESKNIYVKRYVDLYSNMSIEELKESICLDCGLASMQLMLAAKSRGLDTVPMTGFNKEKFQTSFHISKQYLPILLIAIGKAAAPAHATTRLPIDELAYFGEMPQK